MALGLLSDINLTTSATLSGGTWAAALPLGNLVTPGYLVSPARCEDPTDLAASQLQAQLPWPRAITLIGVLFHTLSYNAKYRLTLAPAAGDFDPPLYQSPWTDVVGRIWDSAVLAWEAPNWWSGQPLESDLDLRPRHLWIPVPEGLIPSAVRLEIDDADTEASYFDLGGLWIASAFAPGFNYERGRRLGAISRDQIDEAESGRLFGAARQVRRKVSAEWAGLTDAEAYQFSDMAVRLGTLGQVLFLPDIEDAAGLFREAFPATFETPPEPNFIRDGLNTCSAVFKEILA